MKKLKFVVLILLTLRLVQHPAFAEIPATIDVKKLTCKQWFDFAKDPETAAENLNTVVFAWLIGKLATKNLIIDNRFLAIIPSVHEECEANPSSLLLPIYTKYYELAYKPRIQSHEDILYINQFTCGKDLRREGGKWHWESAALLMIIEGRVSKNNIIDWKQYQEMLKITFIKCQQQPDALLLPMVNEIVNSR